MAFRNLAEEHAHLIADNRLAELAAWNDAELAGLIKELDAELKLGLTGFDSGDLELLWCKLNGDAADAEPQLDLAEELQKKWKTKLGQLWQLGEHRLICGDASAREIVDRLLGKQEVDMAFTDPPYGHNNQDGDLQSNIGKAIPSRKSKNASAGNRPFANDGPEANELVQKIFSEFARLLKPGACCCCCCGGGGPDPQFARWSLWLDEKVPFKMCVVWDKGGLGMGWHYRRNWECILVAQQPGAASKWYGGNDVPNVIRDIGKIIPSADDHPTPKPVELPMWFLKLHSKRGEIIFEPFNGGGSTLIACENLKRRCFAVEISPAYVAVALQRWSDHTGQKPRLLG